MPRPQSWRKFDPVNALVYGTAWKEDDTARLVGLALRAGVRAFDTANQRKHYFEAAVGDAIAEAVAAGMVRRESLWLQTKFTHVGGQDRRLPYDPRANVTEQVRQSFDSSLVHLGVKALDSYLLHGPSVARGFAPEDWEAWAAMERLHAEGRVKAIGVSNVTLEQLEGLLARAKVPPSVVQNRCYASRGWDRGVRAACRAHGIAYQAFSLLTANRKQLAQPKLAAIAARHGLTREQLVFRFALDAGMTPLTGTTDEDHMRLDLAAAQAPSLDADELRSLEEIG
jgi:diketogulonate reductase-like aldo/keto reductase